MKDYYVVLTRLEGDNDYYSCRIYNTYEEAEEFANKMEAKLRKTRQWGEVTIATNDRCTEEQALDWLDPED